MEGENPISTKSEFSSPLGDGVVLNYQKFYKATIQFSSPLGDGVVLAKK